MLKVLVVDDSVLMRNNIKTYIQSIGHEVVGEAEDGLQAVNLCSALKPDIITMDITMPDMDGITAIEKIKEFDESVNVIILTAMGQEEIVMKALKAGAKRYVLKPITETNLKEAINDLYPDLKSGYIDDEFLDD